MIKFFRKIRQKLLSENKFSKYLIYAVGEILLVVIGILIALQINNRNEFKKDRAFETKMLKEIRKEIIKDTIYFNKISKRAETSMNGGEKLLELMDKKITDLDSVSQAIYDMSQGFAYIYHKGAYETFKSVGLDKISNDSLRFMLTDLYDFSLPRTKILLSNIDISNQTTLIDRRFKILNIIGTKISADEIATQTKVKKSFFTDPEISKMAVNMRSNNYLAFWRLKDIKDDCSFVLKLLDKELNK